MGRTDGAGNADNLKNEEIEKYRGNAEYTTKEEDTENAGNKEQGENPGNTAGMDSKERAGNIRDRKRAGNTESKGYGESQEKTERKRNRESKENKGSRDTMDNTRKRKKLTGSFVAKTAAFFLLVLSVAGAVASCFVTIYMVSADYYGRDITDVFLEECSGIMYRDIYDVRNYIAAENLGYAKEVCRGKNVDIALLEGDLQGDNGSATDNPALIWTTYDGSYEIGLTEDFYLQFNGDSLTGSNVVNYHKIYALKDYVFRIYFNMDFPEKDQYAEIYNECMTLYDIRYTILWILGVSIFVALNSFLFLMCSAGHRNDAEGIQPSVFSSIPLDLYTAFYGIIALFLLLITGNFLNYGSWRIIDVAAVSVSTSAVALWCTFYLRELAVRMKLGGWWRNSIIYYVLKLLGRIIRLCWKGICAILKEIPSILGILIAFMGITILELFIAVFFGRSSSAVIIWMMEKAVLFLFIVYIAMMCRRLLNGSRALAEGRQEEIINTDHMFGDFAECGENLNSIRQGISRAVAERMRSEHLKTELITNVSHDLKTPLTSIINYANLIAEEPTENEKITEYSEVLVRQSGRLKKLLEDLLEASKATTGNLEVNFQPCEVSVILSQAIGEYQQRMEEKQLELIVTQPEREVRIMADGRHLWRVFDNLLNNICKYAREDSRVYLSVEVKEREVSIVFRNMSKYALNISPEELQERFVRGDKSRHMDGNGLGLSIARSLTELQNGRMEIVTDGDLFKVSLCFDIM